MDKPPTQPQFQHTPALNQTMYWCLYVAILAAFIACCADVSLLYVAQGGYEAQDYSFLGISIQSGSMQGIIWAYYSYRSNYWASLPFILQCMAYRRVGGGQLRVWRYI
ncbi:MAG: hypothetical protein IPL33_16475 [Sphingobacteriales bacterium]|nr:hypothetical protein [Sphingobacteriales bacterium]